MIHALRAASLALLLALPPLVPAAAASHFGVCDVPPDLRSSEGRLPGLAHALHSAAITRIVVLGSTSSTGRGASSRDRSYVRRLGGELARALPGRKIEVVDRTRESQTAAMMRDRLASEILPLAPALVIWETGSSDAIQHLDPTDFGEALAAGIGQLKAAGIDVLLVSPHFAPHMASVVNFDDVRNVMMQVAASQEVGVFRRGDIMRHLAESGNFEIDLGDDRPTIARAVDRLHLCLAATLAQVVAEGIAAP